MKKVLIITYSFPPAENACAMRADSFIRQLGKYGWEPLILTADIKAKASSGPEERAKAPIPEGIDIVRTGPWQSENLPAPLRSVAGFLSALLVPDREMLWELFCIRKAVRLAKSIGADLIYTLSPPSSAHLIGLRLKKKNPRIPWVADFCEVSEASGRGLKRFKEQYVRKLINSVLDEADCIIACNSSISGILAKNSDDMGQQADICWVPDGRVQELTEQFEKACRIIATRKLNKNNNE